MKSLGDIKCLPMSIKTILTSVLKGLLSVFAFSSLEKSAISNILV